MEYTPHLTPDLLRYSPVIASYCHLCLCRVTLQLMYWEYKEVKHF